MSVASELTATTQGSAQSAQLAADFIRTMSGKQQVDNQAAQAAEQAVIQRRGQDIQSRGQDLNAEAARVSAENNRLQIEAASADSASRLSESQRSSMSQEALRAREQNIQQQQVDVMTAQDLRAQAQFDSDRLMASQVMGMFYGVGQGGAIASPTEWMNTHASIKDDMVKDPKRAAVRAIALNSRQLTGTDNVAQGMRFVTTNDVDARSTPELARTTMTMRKYDAGLLMQQALNQLVINPLATGPEDQKIKAEEFVNRFKTFAGTNPQAANTMLRSLNSPTGEAEYLSLLTDDQRKAVIAATPRYTADELLVTKAALKKVAMGPREHANALAKYATLDQSRVPDADSNEVNSLGLAHFNRPIEMIASPAKDAPAGTPSGRRKVTFLQLMDEVKNEDFGKVDTAGMTDADKTDALKHSQKAREQFIAKVAPRFANPEDRAEYPSIMADFLQSGSWPSTRSTVMTANEEKKNSYVRGAIVSAINTASIDAHMADKLPSGDPGITKADPRYTQTALTKRINQINDLTQLDSISLELESLKASAEKDLAKAKETGSFVESNKKWTRGQYIAEMIDLVAQKKEAVSTGTVFGEVPPEKPAASIPELGVPATGAGGLPNLGNPASPATPSAIEPVSPEFGPFKAQPGRAADNFTAMGERLQGEELEDFKTRLYRTASRNSDLKEAAYKALSRLETDPDQKKGWMMMSIAAGKGRTASDLAASEIQNDKNLDEGASNTKKGLKIAASGFTGLGAAAIVPILTQAVGSTIAAGELTGAVAGAVKTAGWLGKVATAYAGAEVPTHVINALWKSDYKDAGFWQNATSWGPQITGWASQLNNGKKAIDFIGQITQIRKAFAANSPAELGKKLLQLEQAGAGHVPDSPAVQQALKTWIEMRAKFGDRYMTKVLESMNAVP